MALLVGTLLMAMVITICNCQGGPSFCHFPFIHKTVTYTDCTTEGDPSGQLWCSTKTDNQNNHIMGNWMHCTGEYRGPSNCRFPFIYKNDIYSACTTAGDPNGQLWCSTKTDNLNNHIRGNFRLCISATRGQQLIPTGQPLTATGQRSTVIPTEDECGQSWRNNIVLGNTTDPGDWPWLTALGLIIDARFSPFCGGTLITKQHVLTAAHCFLDVRVQDTIVRLGEYNVDKDGDGAQDFNIVDQRVGAYNQDTRENDIITLKLDRPLSFFTDSIRAACLPYHLRNENFEGNFLENSLTVVGWGRFNNSIRRNSPIPLQGHVSVVPIRDCQRRYIRSYNIDNRHLCAGTGGTDSCNGDSGGPLNYLDLERARFYVVGLVSFGPGFCGSTSQPGVYVRIGSYIDWIEQSIRQLL